MAGKVKPQVIAIEEHYFDRGDRQALRREPVEAGAAPSPRGSRRAAYQGHGRSRHRHPGALARRARDPSHGRSDRGAARPRRQRPAVRDDTRQPRTLRRIRNAARSRPQSRRGRARALRSPGSGSKGAMVHGLTNGLFIDDKRFWPIFERAQALDVPIYLHPAHPHPAVIEAYYKDYVKDFPAILIRRDGASRSRPPPRASAWY